MNSTKNFIAWVVAITAAAFITLSMFWVVPQWNVYRAGQQGRAELARAESNRRIAILEAEAQKESATLLAGAEIERAKGVAEANEIIGESLRANEAYLTWLWIEALKENTQNVIYVPTEANLPILEANRFSRPVRP